MSDDNLNQAAALIKFQIQAAWAGQFEKDGITYTVVTHVQVSVMSIDDAFAAGEAGRVDNVVAISPVPVPNLTDKEPGKTGSLVAASGNETYDFGHFGLKSLRTSYGAAHEFAHLSGVPNLPGPVLSNGDPQQRRLANVHLQAQDADFHAALGGEIYASRRSFKRATAVYQNVAGGLNPSWRRPKGIIPNKAVIRAANFTKRP